METLILLGLLCGIGYWLYREGKRIGSRGGFHAGRKHCLHRKPK